MIVSPSLSALPVRFWLKLGSWFVLLTVHVNVSVAATVAPPSSLTVMEVEKGLPASAVFAIVPVMRPVDVLIDRPVGRPVAA